MKRVPERTRRARPRAPTAAAAHLLFALFLALVAVATHAGAVRSPAEAELEQSVQEVAVRLRCEVCQNQTIADSSSAMAMELKGEIRERLRSGETVAQATEFMIARYGDFVLYKPPLRNITWLLWAGPFVLLVGALAALLVMLRRRRRRPSESPPAAS